MLPYGRHLPRQLGLEYELKPEEIHNIVQLWFVGKLRVIDIVNLTGVPDFDVVQVINQEKWNIKEAEQFKEQEVEEPECYNVLPYWFIKSIENYNI